MIWTLYPFGVMLVIALIDVQGKGRMMAKYGWKELPDFWRDRGVVAWRSILATLLGIAVLGAVWLGHPKAAISSIILGSCGVESLMYCYLLKPCGVKQEAWWLESRLHWPSGRIVGHERKDGLPPQTIGHPPATWFDYPPSAPWLRVLPGFWWTHWNPLDRPTRREVYTVASIGSVLAILLGVW